MTNKLLPYMLIILLGTGCFSQAKAEEISKPRILEFYSEFCKNCNLVKPVLQKMKKKYQDRLEVVEIDVLDPANRNLMKNYPILALPALAFQKPNGNYSMIYGYNSDEEIAQGTKEMLR
ncbi:MAG: thioredoxin family protein [Candidatus Obscuribacterales bacterium]|nr:thioredoxin family protein [Candidatus Obscuribacterales bacterium]